MNLNDLLSKVPKPILVLVILGGALAFMVYNDPLKDECEIQAKVFERNTKGILKGVKIKNKIQFAKISPQRDICRDGNSRGACSDYFDSLRSIATELKSMSDKCKIKYAENNEGFLAQLSSALQVMSLVAWGDKPPSGPSERAGWLAEPDLKTFCGLKRTYVLIAGEEGYTSIRNTIYLQYPDQWAENTLPKDGADGDTRKAEDRPRALKSATNPNGKFENRQIFERSLFSIRCELYL